MKAIRTLSGLMLAAVLAACGSEPLQPEASPDASTMDTGPAAALVLGGEIGPGSAYEIVVPPFWNGDLVLYAHGYVDPAGGDPLTEPELALLSALPAMGYATAWSTYSEDGLAIKDGAQRTRQLRGVFKDQVGDPGRTFLVGGSLGGLVAIDLAERFPGHYDGALALCGMVGGSQAQVDYVAHVRVLFDALYPGVLPGSLFDNPPLTPGQVAALVGAAVLADPGPAAVLGSVMDATFGTPVPASNPDQFLESLVTALAFDVRGFADVLDRTHGHIPFDNREVWYSGSGFDILLNPLVARYDATRDALRYLDRYYEPDGDLEIPVVTLHNVLDPVVPILHEERLAATVAQAGSGALVDQLTPSTVYGHCAFTEAEVVNAFLSLVGGAG